MGPLQGKVVADMFAGDGYYTWKLLGAGARVLAIDDNPANIAALEARKKAEGIGDERLLVRLTPPGVTGLIPNEVDLALIIRNTPVRYSAGLVRAVNGRRAGPAHLLPGELRPATNPGGTATFPTHGLQHRGG
ncbi:MAG: DUF1698 domain-containing protein [Flavobacteriales bacterium]|nr:DUF1698 domain-containing protein [Flavobacteriales bacterium]